MTRLQKVAAFNILLVIISATLVLTLYHITGSELSILAVGVLAIRPYRAILPYKPSLCIDQERRV